MNRLSRCNRKRNAITLIEVVVALVLLASLVSGMVTAYSAHHRQALMASRRQAANLAADRLLSQWYSTAEPQVPRNSDGELPGVPTLVWRTEIIHQNTIETLPVEVVRLQVFSGAAKKPLTQVDVILPISENRL